MYELIIPKGEYFIDGSNMFLDIPETKIYLEHSLISLKKWESKWHKPFLGKDEKTPEEILDYIRCMTIGSISEDPIIYNFIPPKTIEEIIDYIQDPMTATWFGNDKQVGAAKSSKEIVTNEIIYHWMISLNIPVEFQEWHLNQLLTLIKVVNIKNAPKRKMSRKEEYQQRAALNAARRAKYNSKG